VAHGKAKLTPAGRFLLVDRIVREGWAPAHAAAMAGVSRATAYKWLGRWRTEGEVGLVDRSSRPHSMPCRTSSEREAELVALRRSWRRGPHLLGGSSWDASIDRACGAGPSWAVSAVVDGSGDG
jgi:leucine-zipper of insertion element IS481